MNIDKIKKELYGLTTRQLRELYAQHYDHTPTSRNRAHLTSKILWSVQSKAQGGDISQTARERAMAIADDRFIKTRFPTRQRPDSETKPNTTKVVSYQPELSLLPGSVLHREYRGENIRLLVLENGFEWNGQKFKSLSSAARTITGTRWNGKLFFGLKKGAK